MRAGVRVTACVRAVGLPRASAGAAGLPGRALSEQGPKAAAGKGKVAALSSGLRSKRVADQAAQRRGNFPRPRRAASLATALAFGSLPAPPACQVGKAAGAGRCSGLGRYLAASCSLAWRPDIGARVRQCTGLPFLGVRSERKCRPAGLSGPDRLEPALGQMLGTRPSGAPQLGPRPQALSRKVVAEADTETRLPA